MGLLLVYADGMSLLGDNINTTNKNTETLTDASKKVCLEINIETVNLYVAVSSLECKLESGHKNNKTDHLKRSNSSDILK
jgi:hypothetical protein